MLSQVHELLYKKTTTVAVPPVGQWSDKHRRTHAAA